MPVLTPSEERYATKHTLITTHTLRGALCQYSHPQRSATPLHTPSEARNATTHTLRGALRHYTTHTLNPVKEKENNCQECDGAYRPTQREQESDQS